MRARDRRSTPGTNANAPSAESMAIAAIVDPWPADLRPRFVEHASDMAEIHAAQSNEAPCEPVSLWFPPGMTAESRALAVFVDRWGVVMRRKLLDAVQRISEQYKHCQGIIGRSDIPGLPPETLADRKAADFAGELLRAITGHCEHRMEEALAELRHVLQASSAADHNCRTCDVADRAAHSRKARRGRTATNPTSASRHHDQVGSVTQLFPKRVE